MEIHTVNDNAITVITEKNEKVIIFNMKTEKTTELENLIITVRKEKQ